jgi:hypothetical protein
MMNKGKKTIKVEYKSLVIIWLALLASQVLFLAMVYVIEPELLTIAWTKPTLGNQPLITLAFIVSAIVFFVLSFVMRRQYGRRAVEDRDAGCVQTGLVLGCVLSEIPSLFGLLLAFIWNYQFFFLWIALGAIGILFHFPRRGNLDAAVYGPGQP